jgi:anti-sigma regulatory factor (Ser/Thr protein kinase)/serine/threonine protein phosphatase PrpC
MAKAIGFPDVHGHEVGLVATELAANLLRHAAHGTITLSRIDSDEAAGIQIESRDAGPGISDVDQAITDGYSTAGGLGLGLGTVNRLMDELDFYSAGDCGLHLVCKRWIRPDILGRLDSRVTFGAATRPYRRAKENGDAFLVKQWDAKALIAVIDGLGHGQFAQRASQAARHYIEQHFDLPLEKLFRGVGRACRATRGVVMALSRLDMAQGKLQVASIGNIETRLVGGSEKLNLMIRRGIVGLNAPEAVVTESVWSGRALLVMHSDGLTSQWTWDKFRDLEGQPPAAIAQRLLGALGKSDDDATVVVTGSVA